MEEILDGKLYEKVATPEKGKVNQVVLGKKTAAGLEHNPCRELILSAPKSVSIMCLVAIDERVLEAHEAAVSATLDYYERNMVYVRVQKDGVSTQEQSNNIVVAKFTHICSRTNKSSSQELQTKLDIPDPQLHTHCLIANMTRFQDGVWRSVIFDKMYDNKDALW